MTYFGPALDPPLGGCGRNTLMHVRDLEHFIPTKFYKHPLSSSIVKTDYVFPYIYMHANRRSANGWRATFWKIGRRRPIVGRRRHRFWLNFWSADDFFVEAPKLKVSLTDPPIFMGFVIVEASGDGRPMIGRQSADVLKKCTS